MNHEHPHPKDFNSRPSARGDSASCREDTPPAISIHAPPRGATRLPSCRTRRLHISIHAPPRGATFLVRSILSAAIISIHAPPRGATTSRPTARASSTYFNSRPSARGDAFSSRPTSVSSEFQFTPLREGRPTCSRKPRSPLHFNSRPSARGDEVLCTPPANFNFNSRPSARGDGETRLQAHIREDFNSRPSARGDQTSRSNLPPPVYFNSRPSARGDLVYLPNDLRGLISIHAPPRGATG